MKGFKKYMMAPVVTERYELWLLRTVLWLSVLEIVLKAFS